MKSFCLCVVFLFILISVQAQTLYIKTFGNVKHTPIIYFHGGPGYNCSTFETTTALNLSKKGFFVIVYDRRGEGRSIDKNAQFTFQEAFNDLDFIYQKFGLKKSVLLGHSFGGIIATLYAERSPQKVQSVILMSAPISLQESFKTILSSCKRIYQAKKDSISLNYISLLEKMDTASIEYSSYCLRHAMQNGFYITKQPTDEAKSIYSTFKTDTLLIKYATQMTYPAVQGFWKNEKYTTLNLETILKRLKEKQVSIYALYGKEDGLYADAQILKLQEIVGKSNLHYFDNCSHNVFIDQQSKFIESLQMWIK